MREKNKFHKGSVGETKTSNKKAQTGKKPGLTRHLNYFKVSTNPTAYLCDTPGVMYPPLSFPFPSSFSNFTFFFIHSKGFRQ